MKKIIGIVLFTLLGSIVVTETCHAIPAVGRKYRISCKVCHAPAAPKLKAYGDDYAGDGFRLEDYDSPGYYVDAGDERLSLLREFPLAVRLDGFVTYNMTGSNKSDFGTPYLMKLLSGGAISDHVSYYFYFYMSEAGEIAGVEDAYLMYNNLFNSPLDIMLGQFQVSDPLFKRELRLSLEDYELYTSQIGMSRMTLKYDKGVMLTYGFETGTDVVFEVVNGNGITEAEFNIFDEDKYKSYMGRISQNIGDFLRVGGFAYLGKEHLENNFGNAITNEVSIIGPDFTLTPTDKLEVNFQYTLRNDARVFAAPSSPTAREDLTTEGLLGEAIFMPQGDQSNWYLLGLYNKVESDFNPADYESFTFHGGYLLRRNVRLAGEYTYVTEGMTDEGMKEDFGRFSVGVVSAF